jgi:hypothetical protein
MIKTVVKHSYVKGRHGKDRSRAHINYISHRGGEDREKGGRKFFDKEREDLDAREVKQRMYELADERGVIMHKIILSPGLNTDAKEYTRELMDKLERIKDQKLDWRAVVHGNTEHQHVHVVLMGKDEDGHRVRIGRDDHNKLREFGDEYLNREHKLERYLDRELQDIVRSKEYDRGGDELFRVLIFGKQEGSREDDPDRARREFEEIDEKLRKSFEDKRSAELYPKPWGQRQIEQAGRLSEHHYDYTSAMARERLERIAKESPELAESIQQELDYMRERATEDRSSRGKDIELDRVLGWGSEDREKSAERAAESFESDRVSKPEQQDRDAEEERDEQEDFDPWSG